ncbi:hypothetical protein HDU98_007708 [Podochytrium sp. JEL0797]|nr:hypothetical protein HDU98_007708 [Podochytrium sp. JEL0797]
MKNTQPKHTDDADLLSALSSKHKDAAALLSLQNTRAFLARILNDKVSHVWFAHLANTKTTKGVFYDKHAFMRDSVNVPKLLTILESELPSIPFAFTITAPTISTAAALNSAAVSLPSPAPLVHALSHAASSNASAFASSALQIGSTMAGFGFSTLAAAKESLDSQIITLNLGGKKSMVDVKQHSLSQNGSVKTSGGGSSLGPLAVVNHNPVEPVDLVFLDDPDVSDSEKIVELRRALEVSQKQAADEKEARLKLQIELVSLKHLRDREVAAFKSDIANLQRKVFYDINDI